MMGELPYTSIPVPVNCPSNCPHANPARKQPRGSVGLCVPVQICRTNGASPVIRTCRKPVCGGTHGLISSCAMTSTKAGRTEMGRRRGASVLRFMRSISVFPFTRPKRGVEMPGLCVAPSPETKTNVNSSDGGGRRSNARAAVRARVFVTWM